MLDFLKNHPFAVEAHFDSSLVLTFAFPKEKIAHLIPACLTLDTFQEEWAFLAVAIVSTKGLRPAGFPKALGNDFILTGYRAFVRYTDNRGKRLRGLFILKSETNKKMMEVMGNLFTHYNYSTTDIKLRQEDSILTVNAIKTGLNIQIKDDDSEVHLPPDSPFADWKEARRFAGPLPFTFTYTPETGEVLIVEGVREHWTPRPVQVISSNIPYFQGIGLDQQVLANAFLIHDIPYRWKKGRKEQWKP